MRKGWPSCDGTLFLLMAHGQCGGSSLIQSLLQGLGWALDFDFYHEIRRKNIDTNRTREKIKMIHMLAQQGAKWVPNGRTEIAEIRRSFEWGSGHRESVAFKKGRILA